MKVIVILLASVFISSCGKVFQKKEEDKKERRREEIRSDVDVYLRSQVTHCDDLNDCNPSIGKFVIWNQTSATTCSGALISSKLFITSASCLPRNMRIAGIGCSGKAVVSFPQAGRFEAQNAYCSQIEFSDVLDTTQDPALTRTNFAIIKFKEHVNRPFAKISRTGLSDQRSYYTWTSSVDSTTSSTIIKKKCRPVYQSYANPFGDKETSPSMVLKGCTLEDGNMGGVLVNNKENIVGLMSSNLSSTFIQYLNDSGLYTESLSELSYVSNTFCLEYNSQYGDDYTKECLKRLSVYNLDRMRSKMIHSRENHKDIMKKYEDELEQSDKYFNWNIEFLAEKQIGVFEIDMARPKCFVNVKKWIREFKKGKKYNKYGSVNYTIPNIKIATKLDSSLRAYSDVIEDGIKEYRFSFSPRNLYSFSNSYVRVVQLDVLSPTSVFFKDVNETCE